MRNKNELQETLKRWLLETIEQFYIEDINEILDDNNDRIYEIIDETVGEQLCINWNRYEYILDFYTDEDIDYLGVEDLDKNDGYSVLFAIFNEGMIEYIDEVREELKNKNIGGENNE